jgi:type I restriction enzyme S subunit
MPFENERQTRKQRIDARLKKGLFALTDQLDVRLGRARGASQRARALLLARAFAGQLIPQDPDDELASALLERLGTVNR